MQLVSNFLNKITMYRLMLYFLSTLVLLSASLGLLGVMPYNPLAIISQTILFLFFCFYINLGIARLLKIKPNTESSVITGLILSLLMGPSLTLGGLYIIFGSSLFAIASKYIFVWRKSHIFNPAVFGALASSLVFNQTASWWVGSMALLPLIIIGGLLILKKIQKFSLVVSFLAVYGALFLADRIFGSGASLLEGLSFTVNLIFSPFALFFAVVMLIEPMTSPAVRRKGIYYAGFTAILLFLLQKFAGGIPYLIELSLLSGNLLAKIMSPDFRQTFILKKKEKLSASIFGFWFSATSPFGFLPGQFLEYTLSHKNPDNRGVRRYFTIASSPTEKEILLTTRFAENGSSFKKTLIGFEAGGEIVASRVSGDFTLPKDPKQKLIFIAGGIGITPMRSMVKYLLDRGEKRDIVLFYGARSVDDLVFREIFEEAERRFDMKNIYVLPENNADLPNSKVGIINLGFIKNELPDMDERTFYISGPEPMVEALEKELARAGVSEARMKRDYFPGYEVNS